MDLVSRAREWAVRFLVKSAATVAGSTPYRSGRKPTSMGMSFMEASTRGYKNLVWVYRCVTAIGNAVGSVPWKAYRREPSGKLVWLPNHPLEKLLENPNPYFTRKEIMNAWAIYLSLAGNCYYEVVRVAKNRPYQFFVLRPDWMTPIPDAVDYIKGYKLDPQMGEQYVQTLLPDQVLHFKYLDPTNEYVGMSPLTAASRTMATEDSAVKWNKLVFDNSAVPSGVLKVPATTMKKKERDELREELEKEFTQDNLHRPMILWGGMEWSKMSMDAKDLDFLKQRELNKYELCAILECPAQIVGATSDPTYSNYDVARTAFWEDSIIPKLEWFQSRINMQIAPAFGPDIEAHYDPSSVPAMRSIFRDKVDTSAKLFNIGYTVNQINRRMGLGFDDVAWGDVWWAQMNMMPVSSGDLPEASSSSDETGNDDNL